LVASAGRAEGFAASKNPSDFGSGKVLPNPELFGDGEHEISRTALSCDGQDRGRWYGGRLQAHPSGDGFAE
jgi:hypothetical protein